MVLKKIWEWMGSMSPRKQQILIDLSRQTTLFNFRDMVLEETERLHIPVDVENEAFQQLFNELAEKIDTDEFVQMGLQVLPTVQVKATEQLRDMFMSILPKPKFDFEDWRTIKMPFSLRVGKSQLSHPEAGQGLFLDGAVLPGTVVAIYPGIVYTAQDWRELPNYPQIDKDNSFLMARNDYFVLDAKDYDTNRTIPELRPSGNDLADSVYQMEEISDAKYINNVRGKRDFSLIPYHPYAFAHMVNHPDESNPPNVMAMTYDFPLDFDKYFRPHIPNKYIRAPGILMRGIKPVMMHSLVLLTTRFVRNEELLLNYRYNPNNPNIPSWYKHVDQEEAERLWKM